MENTKSDFKADAFNYKLDLLKWELSTINEVIARMDNMAQTTKNWAILIWAGTVSLALGNDDANLRSIILFCTAIIPILFWMIDTFFRRLQRRSAYRMDKIKEFVNSPDYDAAFKQKSFEKFEILDPVARSYNGEEEYEKYISMKNTLRFKEIMFFYLGLIFISILLGTVFYFVK
ncbi:MAG: hypothetical protein P1U56_18285 [Saprospiraceae bacterium]|nr:hypothetical protein [Saprospiraceae bacterium]